MRVSTRSLSILASRLIGLLVVGGIATHDAQNQNSARPAIATTADFQRAMKELFELGPLGREG